MDENKNVPVGATQPYYPQRVAPAELAATVTPEPSIPPVTEEAPPATEVFEAPAAEGDEGRSKRLITVGIIAGVVVGGGLIAGLLLHGHHSTAVSYGRGSIDTTTQAQAATNGVIPLNQAGTDSSDSNSLKATSGGGSVGQLGGKSGGGNQLLGGSTGNGGSGSNGSSNSGPSLPDPSTFKDYDKYKDATQALFGDIQKGDGATLAANQKAAVYYRGYLTNGQLFDASKPDSSGNVQPFTFTVGAHQVITGWEQGLVGMKVGGVRLLIVPPSAGYGASGQGSIPPNSVLVFEVQLAAIE